MMQEKAIVHEVNFFKEQKLEVEKKFQIFRISKQNMILGFEIYLTVIPSLNTGSW